MSNIFIVIRVVFATDLQTVGRARGHRNLVTTVTSYVSREIAASIPRQTRPNLDESLSTRSTTVLHGLLICRRRRRGIFVDGVAMYGKHIATALERSVTGRRCGG
jgi:hypothetical protein